MSSVMDMHACICHRLVFLLVLFAWYLMTTAFHAAANINDQRHISFGVYVAGC